VSTWILVWLVVTLLTTIAVIIVLVALVRHAMLVGRSAKKFQSDVGELSDELARQTALASDRASDLQRKMPKSRP
jgi:hypothetical protein